MNKSLRVPLLLATVLVALAGTAGSASASFRGRDGLLAVVPTSGHGVLLVAANGRGAHRICTGQAACRHPSTARWSPDGRRLVISGRPGSAILYADGSCESCVLDYGPNAAFRTNTTLTTISGGELEPETVEDVLADVQPLQGHASSADWSSQGRLAAAVKGRILAGRVGHLHALGPGSDPSWSPNGGAVAIVRAGWVTILPAGGGTARRLARGTAPAWSPDGRSIAFIASGHRVSVVGVTTRRVRAVGTVRGRSVTWQSAPHAPAACVAPPGSSRLAASATAILTDDHPANIGAPTEAGPPTNVWGCVRATRLERLLLQIPGVAPDGGPSLATGTTTGEKAAIVVNLVDGLGPVNRLTVSVFNLSSGAPISGLSYLAAQSPSAGSYARVDQLVLGADGVTAVRTTTFGYQMPYTEQVVSDDASGAVVRDTAQTASTTPVITNLALEHDTLTWDHAGVARSVTLRAPR